MEGVLGRLSVILIVITQALFKPEATSTVFRDVLTAVCALGRRVRLGSAGRPGEGWERQNIPPRKRGQ